MKAAKREEEGGACAQTAASENENYVVFPGLGGLSGCPLKRRVGSRLRGGSGRSHDPNARRPHQVEAVSAARCPLTTRGSPAAHCAPGRAATLSRPARPPRTTRRHARRGLRASHSRAGVPQPIRAPPLPRRGTSNGYEALSRPRFLLSHCLPGNSSLNLGVSSPAAAAVAGAVAAATGAFLSRRRPAAVRPPWGPSGGQAPAARRRQPRAPSRASLGPRAPRPVGRPPACPPAAP